MIIRLRSKSRSTRSRNQERKIGRAMPYLLLSFCHAEQNEFAKRTRSESKHPTGGGTAGALGMTVSGGKGRAYIIGPPPSAATQPR
jgi:hypothetical protein